MKKHIIFLSAIVFMGQGLMGLTESEVTKQLITANKAFSARLTEETLNMWRDAIKEVKKFVTENSTLLGIKDTDLIKPLAELEKASDSYIDISVHIRQVSDEKVKSAYCGIKRNMEDSGAKLLGVTFRVDNKKKAQKVLLLAIQYLGGIAVRGCINFSK